MTNMQNAEKNIDDNLAELDKKYQQSRQEQITDELIDVISGVTALEKKK
jgi:F-type H+-transporting ATPase subunit gamma